MFQNRAVHLFGFKLPLGDRVVLWGSVYECLKYYPGTGVLPQRSSSMKPSYSGKFFRGECLHTSSRANTRERSLVMALDASSEAGCGERQGLSRQVNVLYLDWKRPVARCW